MQQQGFQGIDQITQQTVKKKQLQESLQTMTNRCIILSQSLKIQKKHMSQISQISKYFDEKITQMSQLLIDFLALQNFLMKQVDMIEEIGQEIKQNRNSINQESLIIKEKSTQLEENNKMMIKQWQKIVNQSNKVKVEKYQQIIKSKDDQINSLKLVIDRLTQSKNQDKNMFHLLITKMSNIQSNIGQLKEQKRSDVQLLNQVKTLQKRSNQFEGEIQKFNQELFGYKNFGLTIKPQKQKQETKLDFAKHQNYNPFNSNSSNSVFSQSRMPNTFDKYPKSRIQASTNDNSSRIVLNEIQKLFSFAVQNVTNVISKSSNELISQLSERDSWEKLNPHKQQTRMSLQQIKKKLNQIDISSKKTIENLIIEVKNSMKQLLSTQNSMNTIKN